MKKSRKNWHLIISEQFETSYPQQIIDMKPITAIIVFFSLMFPALFLGYNNYAEAKENIIKDVNQALAKTVIYKMPTKITADTLQVFKSNLQINQLKETSYPHLDCGNLEIYDSNRLCLSRKGIFVSDGIISDLMFVEE